MVLASVDNALCLCDWEGKTCADRNKLRLKRLLHAEFVDEPSEVLLQARRELEEYFAGERTAFTVPLRFVGTDFQKTVWRALLSIPYGETCSYKDIALAIGNAKAVRAVAQAIGANGIGILCPCHRVIGSDHSLTGFASGLETKRRLLELEASQR